MGLGHGEGSGTFCSGKGAAVGSCLHGVCGLAAGCSATAVVAVAVSWGGGAMLAGPVASHATRGGDDGGCVGGGPLWVLLHVVVVVVVVVG